MKRIIVAFCSIPSLAIAGEPEMPVPSSVEIHAVRLAGAITIDGEINDPAWRSIAPFTHFRQKDPVEGAQPSEKTEVLVGYDDKALYIGARMYDSSPDSITMRLGRRDVTLSSDVFALFIDPYHDRRTGFYFGLDPSGTLFDGILYNDDWSDGSWDGVWEGRVHRDALGWTAEMRIPFSQLRFREEDAYVWGIDFRRDIARRNESDLVTFTPKNSTGFVSRFVDLVGIRDIPAPERVEILPYVTGSAEYLQHAAGDPFNTGARYKPRVGADFKVGLGSNLTLDATVNPDFGQVEVDPAVVNLSDVETYFNEKRPFFLEGSSIFNFGSGGAVNYWNFNFPGPSFFYSRRIGRAPQGSIPDADFSLVPTGTSILGAAKLSGKIGGSWNVGAIQALTSRERADLQVSGVRSSVEVEPLAYYGVFRGQKEFNEGRQSLGFMSTITQRMFRDSRLRDELNSASYVNGLDGWTFLDSARSWVITGWGAASYVTGDRNRLIGLQSNSQHYLQRPDARRYRIDSTATSLTGYAGRIYLVKQSGNIFVNSAFGIIDPRFENNDLGFLSRTDVINGHIGAGYQWVTPTDWYRRAETGGAIFQSRNFDGDITWEGAYAWVYTQLLNFYTIRIDGAYNPQTVNDRRTRGGPLSLNVPGYQVDLYSQTDPQRSVVFDISTYTYHDRETSWNVFSNVEFRPSTNVTFSIGPGFERYVDFAQWVGAFDDPAATSTFGKRYVMALTKQTIVSANIRLNWTFTPQLSLQLYLQPLIAVGDYRDFKELSRPRSYDFRTYGTDASTIGLQDGKYRVDPDGPGPAGSFTFDNPSFNFASFRGNAVLRWEYLPGSTVYFVWTQTRADSEVTGDLQLGRALRQMADIRPDNIFMIKLSYWWNR